MITIFFEKNKYSVESMHLVVGLSFIAMLCCFNIKCVAYLSCRDTLQEQTEELTETGRQNVLSFFLVFISQIFSIKYHTILSSMHQHINKSLICGQGLEYNHAFNIQQFQFTQTVWFIAFLPLASILSFYLIWSRVSALLLFVLFCITPKLFF